MRLSFMSDILIIFLLLATLPCVTASNSFSGAYNNSLTTSPYGTITVNASTVTTPWPISLIFLTITTLLGLPGCLNLG